MKTKTFIAFIFFCNQALVQAQFTPSCVPNNGLKAYWPLDHIYAGNDSWSGIPGTVYGATLGPDRFGNPNAAYYFNGTTDSIITQYAGVLGTHARAVSFWAKTPGANPAIGMYAVTWGSNNQGDRFGCGLDYPAGCTGAGAAYCSATHPISGGGTSNNVWHHYVFQFSGIAPNTTIGSVQIYQDAILVGPTTPSTAPGSFSMDEGTIINTINTGGFNVRFGKANYPPIQSLLNGYLDDIGIWDRMLDTCEIKKLYNCKLNCDTKTTGIYQRPGSPEWDVTVFPNPASDNIALSFPENKNLTVTIHNATGYAVFSENFIGSTSKSLNISSLADGIYLIEIRDNSNNTKIYKKLVVSR